MRMLLIWVAVLFSLTGCGTPQERAAKEGQKRQAEMALMVAQYGPACKQVGYAENTDQWRQCLAQQSAAEEAKRGWFSRTFNRWFGRGSGDTAAITPATNATSGAGAAAGTGAAAGAGAAAGTDTTGSSGTAGSAGSGSGR